MFSGVFGQSASDFRYQAARPAWEKGRPPELEKGPMSPFPLCLSYALLFL